MIQRREISDRKSLPKAAQTMFSSAMMTMVTAISVSISGGNHSASGTKPNAAATSEIECPTVNDVTMITSGRNRRNGITRQNKNSR